MGKASKKKPAKVDAADTVSTAPVRRSKRDLDPNTPPQENPYFSVAVFMLTFAFVLLYRMSDKIYARYFGNQKGAEL